MFLNGEGGKAIWFWDRISLWSLSWPWIHDPLTSAPHMCVPLNQLKVIIWNNKSWSQIFIWLFRSWETCQWGFPKTVCDIVHKIKFCDIWLPGKNLVTQSIAQLFWEKGSSWEGNVYDRPSRLSSVKKGDYIVMQLRRGRRACAYGRPYSRVYWTRKAKLG